MSRAARLLRYVKPYRLQFWHSVAATTVASVLDGFTFALIVPVLQLLFDRGSVAAVTPVERTVAAVTGGLVSPGASAIVVGNLAAVILGTMLLKSAAHYVGAFFAARVQERAAADLRRELDAHIHRLGLDFFTRRRGGELLSRVFSDVEQAQMLFGDGLQRFVRAAALVLVYVAMLVALSWRLSLAVLVLAPAVALVMRPLLGGVRAASARAAELRGELSAAMGESVAGARLVKLHVAEGFESARFSKQLDAYSGARVAALRVSILAHPVSEAFGAVVFVALLVAATLALPGAAAPRPEILVAFLGVTLRLLSPVKMLAHFPTVAAHALAGADRVFALLDHPAEDPTDGGREFTGLQDAIEFRHVNFSYRSGVPVLSDVSFVVPRTATVAIVGPSGAGKSTVADLLPRFIDPSGGAVLLDGISTVAFRRASLRKAIGFVSQETVIFHDTVAANIAYGVTNPDRGGVEAAARAANAHGFIERLSRGYDTVVGERGGRLSGGERQRIAIARALYRDAPILILDEATAALDDDTETLVREALDRLVADRTVIVIAHRLRTVERADRIVVLEGGRVVETGAHRELMQLDGAYRQLRAAALAGHPA